MTTAWFFLVLITAAGSWPPATSQSTLGPFESREACDDGRATVQAATARPVVPAIVSVSACYAAAAKVRT